MNEDFRNQVFASLRLKETDELIEIWQNNNHSEWSETAFDVIQQILRTRLGQLPPQDTPIYKPIEQDTNDESDFKKNQIIELSEDGDINGLIDILENDPDEMISLEAAMALAQLQDERGLDHLISALENPNTDISSNARDILVEINHPKGKSMPQNKLKRDAHLSNENQLPGFPGYRTREGRSGYDPLDSNRESAHMEGTFYRNIFTLRARTRNIFYLVMMFIFGVIPFAFLLFAIIITVTDVLKSGDASTLGSLFMPVLFTAITGAITINFVLSILEIAKIIPPLYKNPPQSPKDRKKKMPKRRKDFQ
jgi:hypothetical protein